MIAAALLVVGGALAGQVFSPGPLSSAHKQLDGIASCTKCHGEGNKHDNTKCLDCHKEIGRRIDANEGYHAKNKATLCAECHKEHKGGTGASLLEWSERGFNHALTGWPLSGQHKKPDCKNCHELRRIADADARAFLTEKKRDRTFLGMSTACTSCHFDEHRGQEGADCVRCHGAGAEEGWKPIKFVHASPFADFRLKGQHRNVACAKCHDDTVDETTPADAFPKPRAKNFMQMQLKGVGQNSCTSCHDDVHHGEFGKNCVKCHTEDGWKIIKAGAEDTGFHDKTDFPLRGEHTSVSCKACHGPFPALGQKSVFKGLKHAQCSDCHADAHAGQIDSSLAGDCAKCHSVTGFMPPLFDADAHKGTKFALEGSHRAVACNLCHKSDKAIAKKVPASLKKELAAKGRPLLVSDVKLALGEATACETCHTDVHGGQFSAAGAPEGAKARTCSECHSTTSFADVTFNHDDSRFPLTGKHKEAVCEQCHSVKPDAKGRMRGVVVYRPVQTACAQCHSDVHAGQLKPATCDTCHATSGFKPVKFDHAKQSTFPLEGKHKEVRCAGCHPVVDTGTWKTAKYKPIATTCGTCHDDEHKGTFDSFAPPVTGPPAATTTTTTTAAVVAATTATTTSATAKNAAGCVACHQPLGWSPARFAHERTPFTLKGKHAGVACVDCHGSDTSRPIPTSCAGCHQDPHAQEFGLQCRSCHDESGFAAPTFMVDAHRRGNFPLVGRHAALPCEECHVEKRERTFTRTAVACVGCHGKDAARASTTTVNHARSPFTGDCRACHQPLAFSPATLPQHESCFPILRGVHSPVTCNECHRSLAGTTFTGSCNAAVVTCAECHVHNADVEAKHHKGVPGYEHVSAKCAGCHHSPT